MRLVTQKELSVQCYTLIQTFIELDKIQKHRHKNTAYLLTWEARWTTNVDAYFYVYYKKLIFLMFMSRRKKEICNNKHIQENKKMPACMFIILIFHSNFKNYHSIPWFLISIYNLKQHIFRIAIFKFGRTHIGILVQIV